MARIVMMYRIPKDITAFDEHYFGIYMPLAQRLPGLRRFEIVQGPEALQNDEFHLVATLHFDDADAATWAMASPEGLAADADRRRFVSDVDVLTFLVDGYESDLQNPAGDSDHLVS